MENTIQTQRYTLHGVLWFKFLRWVDKKPMSYLCKVALRYIALVFVISCIVTGGAVLGYVSAAVMQPKTAAIIGIVLLFFYGKSLWRIAKKTRTRSTGSAATYEGVPIDELGTYLIENSNFTTDAIRRLGLSQKRHARIAKQLEDRGVLTRGENNARVLRPITREILIEQLTNDFPYQWSEQKEDWVLRNGPWRTWLGDEEKREQEHRRNVEKLERKKKRLKKQISEIQSPTFTRSLVTLV